MRVIDKIKTKCDWKKVYCSISFTMILFLAEISIYHIFSKLQQYWIALPFIIYIFLTLMGRFIKGIHIVAVSLEIDSILSFLVLYASIKINSIFNWIESNFDSIALLIIIAFFVNLIISQLKNNEKNEEKAEDKSSTQLFNLFYLNTSKAHEIAMLIDNKIMKTIEREQVSEELLKYNSSASFGKKEIVSANIGHSQEDSSKKTVYESFDVKTTKSIMLRKIYETAKDKKNPKSLNMGDLIIFKNIELQQINLDDTVMILNVLQDSKIKNQDSDNIEININKMMDKMLDDFTIDYNFEYLLDVKKSETFIIQLPYKASNNFENGYQHNDLQLGKLSLIGIYRGRIDFSKRESISSRFLGLMSESYNREKQKKEDIGGMKLSCTGSSAGDIQFEFEHNKLNEEMHLIDVIAIIQELNFDKAE